jgi:hypothetical protein
MWSSDKTNTLKEVTAALITDVNSICAILRKKGVLLFPDWETGKRVPQDHHRFGAHYGLKSDIASGSENLDVAHHSTTST